MVDKLLLLLGKLIVESTLFFAVSKMWKKRSSIYSAVRWRIWEHSDNNCVYMKQIKKSQSGVFSCLNDKNQIVCTADSINSGEIGWYSKEWLERKPVDSVQSCPVYLRTKCLICYLHWGISLLCICPCECIYKSNRETNIHCLVCLWLLKWIRLKSHQNLAKI